eukprot:5587315-Amphidinium_carterae.3
MAKTKAVPFIDVRPTGSMETLHGVQQEGPWWPSCSLHYRYQYGHANGVVTVAAMQHVGRRLALCPPPLGAGITLPDLPEDRLAACPIEGPWNPRAWQQVYLDNWDSIAVYPAVLATDYSGYAVASSGNVRDSSQSAGVVRNALTFPSISVLANRSRRSSFRLPLVVLLTVLCFGVL